MTNLKDNKMDVETSKSWIRMHNGNKFSTSARNFDNKKREFAITFNFRCKVNSTMTRIQIILKFNEVIKWQTCPVLGKTILIFVSYKYVAYISTV